MTDYDIVCGDAHEVLAQLAPESFDGVFADPPYGINFMSAQWDHGVPSAELWKLALRALRPGAPLLAFGGTRTHHRLVSAIEDSGFEVRDCMAYLYCYGSGFPKSHSLEKSTGDVAWQGYGTALKPAYEPVCLAMKPLDGTYAHNARAHGVAGLNIDGCRIGTSKQVPASAPVVANKTYGARPKVVGDSDGYNPNVGRWPANLILDSEAAQALDEQSGIICSHGGGFRTNVSGFLKTAKGIERVRVAKGDSGGASRFFYTSKSSTSERNAGMPEGMVNGHPCLKPLDLCRYLATLILPPDTGRPRRLLVPFSGSGSEMIGGLLAGFDEVVGVEMSPEYVAIAEHRIRHWTQPGVWEAYAKRKAPKAPRTAPEAPEPPASVTRIKARPRAAERTVPMRFAVDPKAVGQR
jgi:hypothetical protein